MTSRRDLDAPAEAAMACLGVGPHDDVLVLCNDEQQAIAEALAAAARPLARSVRTLAFAALSRHGEEPPEEVAAAMASADAVFAPTSRSLTHTRARIEASGRGARIATMPTITEEIFARAVAVDYAGLKQVGESLAARLSSARLAHVTTAEGTDIELRLDGRIGRSDDGRLQQRGAFGNLPAGEAYIAPVETQGDGTVVFDGSLAGFGRITTPIRVTVERGRVTDAGTAAGEWLLETLDAGGPHGRSLAELGIGTNPRAILTGNVLEDEKATGTIHLAFGSSAALGGVNDAAVHIDGVVLRPTVALDDEAVIEDGRLVMSSHWGGSGANGSSEL